MRAKVVTRLRLDEGPPGALVMRIDANAGGMQAFLIAVETLRDIMRLLFGKPDLPTATGHSPLSPVGEMRTPVDAKPNWSHIGIPERSPQGAWTVGHTTDGRVGLYLRAPSGLQLDFVERAAQMRLLAEQLLVACQAMETPTTDRVQ